MASDRTQTINVFLDRNRVAALKTKALRRGVWFKALDRIDRVLVNLTIKVNKRIRSYTLAGSLLAIATKLQRAFEDKISRATREIGYPLVCNLSLLATKWGHKSAFNWLSDMSFARYLAVMRING